MTKPGLNEVYEVLVDIFARGGILYLCGNGGSFADAMHIKGELAKSFVKPRPVNDSNLTDKLKKSDMGKRLRENLERGLPVVVLGESHSLRSAYENDREGVFSYAQELNAFAERIKPGALLGISTSGNANNVIAAMTLAKAYGLVTISFTGPDGGQMAQIADIAWRAPGENTPEIQENQVPLYHALCKMIEAHFFG
jgi:D-sedoheptulose 7-phosphate isomerase